jgi:hypothetical protein
MQNTPPPFTAWHDKFMDWLIEEAIKRPRQEDADSERARKGE